MDATALVQPDIVIEILAPAKVNLWLHVVGRRSDGYHLLESLIVFADVGDRLELRAADTLSLEIDGPFAEALADEPDNLVLQSARELARLIGREPSVRIRLTKHLPVTAGIGGGSADAAATLRGLCALWDAAPRHDAMARIAEQLGADVPICLDGRASFVTGVGERIQPLAPLPDSVMLLVNPRKPVSTGPVFKALGGRFTPPRAVRGQFRFGEPETTEDLADALKGWANDLAAPAQRLEPSIRAVLAALEASAGCLFARMSGSGATCFGLFATEEEARAAAGVLADDHPDWWIESCRLLSRAPKPRRAPWR